MNLKQRTLFYGLLMYSIGWMILVIRGMNIIEIFAWGLCFAGIFLLSTTMALRISNALSGGKE